MSVQPTTVQPATVQPTTVQPAGARPGSSHNLAVVRGTISSEPRTVDLPSGSRLVQLEVTTRDDGGTATVPVAWFEPTAAFAAGDEVVVVGSVRRRFFRAGGATASRTEVVARRVVRASRRRDVARLLEQAVAALGRSGPDEGPRYARSA